MDCNYCREDGVGDHIDMYDIYSLELLHSNTITVRCLTVVHNHHQTGTTKNPVAKARFVELLPQGAESAGP
jgi:hypothetical protein